ncbi:MAG: 2-succinyl-5-enolpyruvyl-6-hydroxy-3-cyclohexene-1-carboxylic-acid synthase [Akkermansiaceae bacterium]|nr:2-succinyl-5-enolpyruvyl-6-hydroxy-3-cyclohexene-1-carboxylic-acid synthase [Akkermansiaceae bacterium]
MSSKGWVHDVIGACIAAGVQEYVVCAGARNLALVVALADHADSAELGDISLFSHFEERAAGFFALGRTMQSGAPCAVVTTSGTAVAELLPAVIEAHYQRRPLVVISADRPQDYRGTGAPQAIEQVDLFGDYVEVCEDFGWQDELKIFDGWSGAAPWQLNLCLDDFEMPNGSEQEFVLKCSKVRPGNIGEARANIDMLPVLHCIKEGWKGLVVMLGGLESSDREEVWHFLKNLGVPVLADTTSGLREMLGSLALVDGDRILKERPPAHILRIGEVPTGRFWRDLESMPQVNVVSISRTGFAGLARKSEVVTGDISRCVCALGELSPLGDTMDYLKSNSSKQGRISELLESLPESEPGMIRTLSVMATMGSSLYLGNSLPVREWNDFAQREVPYEIVRANRGANGIDGQIASWLGASAAEQDAWGIFGDLTTMYDLSAPALLNQVECRGRMLVVINNGGGKIFERLPIMKKVKDNVSQLITNSHEYTFESLAAMWGMHYTKVVGMEGFDLEPQDQTTLVEVVPDERQSERFWDKFAQI